VTAAQPSVRALGLWSAILCTFFSLAYVVAQLAEWAGLLGSAGGPHSRGSAEGIELLLFEPFDSFLYAVGEGLERWIRIALIANGCLIPFLALQMYWPPLIWGGAFWAIAFPAATGLLAVHFGRIKELP